MINRKIRAESNVWSAVEKTGKVIDLMQMLGLFEEINQLDIQNNLHCYGHVEEGILACVEIDIRV